MNSTKIFAVLFAALSLSPGLAEAAKKKPKAKPISTHLSVSVEIPPELLAIEKKYLAAKTLEADFSQTDEVQLTGTTKQSSGILMIHHPDQFRWETLKPDKNLLVSDGSRFWFYTPPFEAGEHGQVIERKTSEVQSELANAILAGAFSKVRRVKIVKLAPNQFRLIPDEGTAGTLQSADLEIDLAKNVIRKLKIGHIGGNKTEITLANVKLAGKMNPAYFKFVTPPATDVIRE